MKKIGLCGFLCCILFWAANGQTDLSHKLDSAFNLLKQSGEDSNKILLLYAIGYLYEDNKPDSASYFYTEGGKLSKKLNYERGVFKYLTNITAVLNFESKFDSSLSLNLESVNIAKKLNDQRYLAIAYNNVGASYYNIKDFEKCISYFLKAAAIFDQMKDRYRLCFLYANLTGIYADMDLSMQGYVYGLKSIAIARELKDPAILKESLNNTSNILLSLKRMDSALLLSNQSLELSRQTNDNWTAASCLIVNAGIYEKLGQYGQMLNAAEDALAAASTINDIEVICKAKLYKAVYFINNRDFAAAKPLVHTAIELANKKQIRDALRVGYRYLSYVAFGEGNMADFNRNRILGDSVEKVLLSDKIIKNTQELETRYQVEKKDQEIEIQKTNLANSHLWIGILTSLIISSLLFLLFLRRSYKAKQQIVLQERQLQEQKILQLENEKQLTATQALLRGQEEERSRLAKDLHDGLGGILSSAKYSFNNMKQQFILTEENATAFEKSMSMLDESISELRRVAHNMMPETLMKLSLSEALQDYCQQVTDSGALAVAYQHFGMEDLVVDNTIKTTVYRVVQELINNIIKHAAATRSLVQVMAKDDHINVTVEDDGKGFDVSTLQYASGIGYKNTRSRIAFLKGNMDIQSKPGEGTSVYIEISI
jgi:signal transduction histidine kinase